MTFAVCVDDQPTVCTPDPMIAVRLACRAKERERNLNVVIVLLDEGEEELSERDWAGRSLAVKPAEQARLAVEGLRLVWAEVERVGPRGNREHLRRG